MAQQIKNLKKHLKKISGKGKHMQCISITDTAGEGDTRGHEQGIEGKTDRRPKSNIALSVWDLTSRKSDTRLLTRECGGSPCFLTSE